MTKVFKLSASSLSLMKECPRCFYLTQHKIWKRPSGIFPSLPNGMDKILKEHFNKFMDKNQLPPELSQNGHTNNLKLFNNHELLAIWQNNRKGIQYKDKKGNILRGAVDNILTKNKKLIVLDYKTRGYPLKEDTAEHYQDQLDIYNFLLRKEGHQTEDYAFLLFYIPKEVTPTGEVIFDTNLVKMKVDVTNAERIFERALKLLGGECPAPSINEKGEGCGWCDGKNR